MSNYIQFIIIEDDEILLMSLAKIIAKVYENALVRTFTDGQDGWNYIKKIKEPAVIICDVVLPSVGGLQILKTVKSSDDYKDCYFITMTSSQDKQVFIKALEYKTDDFLYKPISTESIISKVGNAVTILNQKAEIKTKNLEINNLNETLSKFSNNYIELLIKLQEQRMPGFRAIIENQKETALWIAKEYGVEEVNDLNDIVIAASMCYVGRIMLPERMLTNPITMNGFFVNEFAMAVPENAKSILENIPKFENITKIVYHIYENLDGSGAPDKLIGKQIPLGSRILRVLIDFEELIRLRRMFYSKAFDVVEAESNRLYEYKLLALLDQYQGYMSFLGKRYQKEYPIHKVELKEGMVLTRHIITENGMKILSAGTKLDMDIIDKIKDMTRNDPIIGNIYVKDKG